MGVIHWSVQKLWFLGRFCVALRARKMTGHRYSEGFFWKSKSVLFSWRRLSHWKAENFCTRRVLLRFFLKKSDWKVWFTWVEKRKNFETKLLVYQTASFVGLYFFGGQNQSRWTFKSKKLTTICYRLYLQAQYLLKCETYFFRSRQSWKWKAERAWHKGKRLVQSRDQATMKLHPVESCNSSLDLHHYVLALLQQHHAVLHVV